MGRLTIVKKYLNKLFIVFSLLLAFVVFANFYIIEKTAGKTYDNVEDIPYNKVGLVLGTSKYLKNSQLNLYFVLRVNAVVKLFQEHKIDYILISGDNSRTDYDEPNDFKTELVLQGIPEDRIILDYAGFRTLDSVVRAKEVFGQQNLTIISQKFHNQRAIFLAENKGLHAVGFNAGDVTGKYGIKTHIREYLARTKALIDLLFKVQPKFLGPKIQIG